MILLEDSVLQAAAIVADTVISGRDQPMPPFHSHFQMVETCFCSGVLWPLDLASQLSALSCSIHF